MTFFLQSIFKNSRFCFVWLAVTVALCGLSVPKSADSFALETVDVTENQLRIRWSAGDVSWQETPSGAVPIINQFSSDQRPGYPQLPVRTLTFAIPANATVRTNITVGPVKFLEWVNPVPIAPRPDGVKTNDRGEIIGGAYSPALVVEQPETSVVFVEEVGTMGGVRLGKVSFYPLSIETNHIRFTPNVIVNISFEQHPMTTGRSSNETATRSIALHQTVQTQVVNPMHAVGRIQARSAARSAALAPVSADAVLDIIGDGMVKLDYEHLIDHDVDPTQFNPNRLIISHFGTELPFKWMGDGDDIFEAGESAIFYAPPFKSRWSMATPFLLSSGSGPSTPMLTRPGMPHTALPLGLATVKTTVEQNLFYAPDCLCGDLPSGWDGDRWVWAEMRRPGNAAAVIETPLHNVDLSQTAKMTIHQIGFTEQEIDLDHAVRVSLNDVVLGTTRWDGKALDQTTFDLPVGLLKDSNQTKLELIETGAAIDGVWLDAIEFEYVRSSEPLAAQTIFFGDQQSESYSASAGQMESVSIYDVTDRLTPKFLNAPVQSANEIHWGDEGQIDRVYAVVPDNRYLEPVAIRSVAGLANITSGATYAMIAPRAFANSADLQQLKVHRETLGWQVEIVIAEEIYAAFGAGEPNPEAIRDYLEWGYHHWSTRPEMVLLVGDGSVDPKLNRSGSLVTRIPPYLIQADPWIGETAADNRFVTVDGNDALPDMAIGRLPANSLAELSVMVSKILIYETEQPVGKWNREMLIVADDNDAAGDFDASSNHLIDQYFGNPWRPIRQYFGNHFSTIAAAQDAILRQWEAGLGMVMFTGHSSIHQWGAERFIHLDDVPALENGRKLPLVFQMTCFTGSFHSAAFNTLDEQLVRQPNGGAIAVWGATGLGVATGHDALAEAALQSLYVDENRTLGIALLAGKAQLAAVEPAHLDLLDTFNLLGDPALQVKLDLTGEEIYLPITFGK